MPSGIRIGGFASTSNLIVERNLGTSHRVLLHIEHAPFDAPGCGLGSKRVYRWQARTEKHTRRQKNAARETGHDWRF